MGFRRGILGRVLHFAWILMKLGIGLQLYYLSTEYIKAQFLTYQKFLERFPHLVICIQLIKLYLLPGVNF